jgi:hypothetical protein
MYSKLFDRSPNVKIIVILLGVPVSDYNWQSYSKVHIKLGIGLGDYGV